MSSYKLTYFNGRGRGEIARMLFAAAGKEFEDVRIEFPDWPKLKSTFPQGTVPVLDIDGQRVSQSPTIARHLAREFKLYGQSNREAMQIDQIFDTLLDVFIAFFAIIFSGDDETKKGELKDQFRKEKIPMYLDILEKLVGESGKGGFAVGTSTTLADLVLFVYLEHLDVHKELDKYPKLQENRKTVAALPRIAKYIEGRPQTKF